MPHQGTQPGSLLWHHILLQQGLWQEKDYRIWIKMFVNNIYIYLDYLPKLKRGLLLFGSLQKQFNIFCKNDIFLARLWLNKKGVKKNFVSQLQVFYRGKPGKGNIFTNG